MQSIWKSVYQRRSYESGDRIRSSRSDPGIPDDRYGCGTKTDREDGGYSKKYVDRKLIPEIEITCGGKYYFINSITVGQYKKYISLMEKNETAQITEAMFFNEKILQELLNNEVPIALIEKIDAIEFLTTIKTVHFIMQNVIMEKMLNVVEVQQIEKEPSAFDEYDRENGYEDDLEEDEDNRWKTCGEIIDRIVKIAIRILKNSYSQCMKEDIEELLDYLKFELDTINENQ